MVKACRRRSEANKAKRRTDREPITKTKMDGLFAKLKKNNKAQQPVKFWGPSWFDLEMPVRKRVMDDMQALMLRFTAWTFPSNDEVCVGS